MGKQIDTIVTKQPKTPQTAEIVCLDCGKVRVVGKGEVFQVKRCVECQDKYRKVLRKQYRKNRIQQLKEKLVNAEATIDTLRMKLVQAGITPIV